MTIDSNRLLLELEKLRKKSTATSATSPIWQTTPLAMPSAALH